MTEPLQNPERGRVAAIVGRPNVGKSAMFNRLVRSRVAIVHAQSGVTRDRLIREVDWQGHRFDLVDTGGIVRIDHATDHDVITAGIHTQVEAALLDAAVAILVVDGRAGLLPLDEEVARLLRQSGQTTIVAVNKCDDPALDKCADEFARLGYPVYPVSAVQNRGFTPLMAHTLEALPESNAEPAKDPLRVAIIGRPNVGKSSYVNRLLRHDRVIVSDVPGTTRDTIDIPFVVGNGEDARHYLLIDTPGMRRAGKIDSTVEHFSRSRAQQSIERSDISILVLDAAAGPTTQDKKIAAAVRQAAKGCVVLVNKWDLQPATQRQYGPELMRVMPFLGHCPLVFLSAKTGYNIRHSVEAIDLVAAQVRAVIPTGILNRAILDAQERVHAPSVKGKALKLFYATQVGQAPIRIRLFCNDPARLRPAYRDYLVRSLRERFGLEGAPILLQFSRRSPPRGSSAPGARTHEPRAPKAKPRKDTTARAKPRKDTAARTRAPKRRRQGGGPKGRRS